LTPKFSKYIVATKKRETRDTLRGANNIKLIKLLELKWREHAERMYRGGKDVQRRKAAK
jgi:hypothetical protein